MSEKEKLVNSNTTLSIAPNFANEKNFLSRSGAAQFRENFHKKTYVEFSQKKDWDWSSVDVAKTSSWKAFFDFQKRWPRGQEIYKVDFKKKRRL